MEYFENIELLKTKIKELENKVSDVISEKFDFENIYSFIDNKKNTFKPSIMIYGIYNAGKSTLVNAIFGKELSKVSDRAETYKVQSYEYKGFTLYDTPGLNAPIEHETVTREHYKNCEIIIFVLSNESFESAPVYDVLEDILKAKKPLIIVINQKNLTQSEEESQKQNELIIQKIQTNLAKKNIKDLEKLYNLVVVNAKSALKAKQEHKKLLLEKSNIQELENRLINILKENHSKDILNVIKLYVIDFLQQIQKASNKEIKDKETVELAELYDQISNQKTKAKIVLKDIIEECLSPIVEQVADLRDSITEKKITDIINSNLENMNQALSTKIAEIIEDLGTSFSNYSLNINKLFSSNDIKIGDIQDSALSKTAGQISDYAIQQLKNPQINSLIQSTAKEATITVLNSIKSWLPSIMKGKGKVWINSAASGLSKYLGVALTIGSIIYGKYSENAAAEKELNRQQSLYINTVNNMKSLVNKISTQAYTNVCEILNEQFNPKINTVKQQLDTLTQKNQKLELIKQNITNVINSIN